MTDKTIRWLYRDDTINYLIENYNIDKIKALEIYKMYGKIAILTQKLFNIDILMKSYNYEIDTNDKAIMESTYIVELEQ